MGGGVGAGGVAPGAAAHLGSVAAAVLAALATLPLLHLAPRPLRSPEVVAELEEALLLPLQPLPLLLLLLPLLLALLLQHAACGGGGGGWGQWGARVCGGWVSQGER